MENLNKALIFITNIFIISIILFIFTIIAAIWIDGYQYFFEKLYLTELIIIIALFITGICINNILDNNL